MDTDAALAARLHVGRRADLRRRGMTRTGIDGMIAAGALEPLGRFWLGTAGTPADVASALRREHRLTCVSALRHHGVWIPPAPGRHEAARRSAFVPSPGVMRHSPLAGGDLLLPIASVSTSLRHAARCLPPDDLAVILESVAHLGLLTPSEIDELMRTLPVRTRAAVGRIDPRAESGTETRVRRALERRGVTVRAQEPLRGIGRVDLLVGERLIIECDSHAHHTDVQAYARDRRRDQAALHAGFRVLRLTWEDVMLRWEATLALLLTMIRRGDHRAPRGKRAMHRGHGVLAP